MPKAFTQANFKIYNTEFSLIKEHFQIRNPAYGVVNEEKNHFIQFSNKSLNAVSKNVRVFGLVSTYKLKPKVKENKLWLNLNLLSEQEGVFIEQNSLQVGLIKRITIATEWILDASINLGFKNYRIDGNGVVDSKSVFLPDASSGVKLSYNSTHIGISSTQLFAGNFILYRNENNLVRQFYVTLGDEIQIRSNSNLYLDGFLRLPNEITSLSIWLNSSFELNKYFTIGLLLQDLSATVPSLQIDFPIKNNWYALQIGYQIPLNIYPRALVQNNLEVLLKIKI